MDNQNLITKFFYEYNYFKDIHSAGPDIYFHNNCIGYIKHGYVKFLYKGEILYAHENDLIYISSGTRYQSVWYGSPDIEWYSIQFDFASKYAFSDYRFQILKNYPAENFEKIRKTHDKSPLLAISHFYNVLNDIYTKLSKTPDTRIYHTVEPAIKYIENNYSEQIDIKTLSKLCGLSESGFFKSFKKVTGITPITYKHNVMIEHAVELISNTSMPIEEISNLVGFGSSNLFRKVFTKILDKTPRELRKK